ncbi:hypothetical protein JTE90_006867 [Oedothorax gibbosus]|uniref:J domain-containing protein n=1 Tax=Oedothorax gibbosus TaxID=931172 RepID=A0AAV6UI47_9ARAC|nr:hypothetical protein JTE90_006867 [Oedothorax gibbosus]
MDSILNYKKCEDDDFYKLLGCDESATVEQILTEYKALSLQCHPDKKPDDPEAVTRFQKIQKAKEILTNPDTRSLYDKWRACGFCMPFEKFLNLNKASHCTICSMHWASKKQKDLMLENSCVANESNKCSFGYESRMEQKASWQSDPGNDVLKRFRNYEI